MRAHEREPIARWLRGLDVAAGVVRYPLMERHPAPPNGLHADNRRLRNSGSTRIGVIGFSAGGHLPGLGALADTADANETVDFALLGHAISSMEETETNRPSRLVLLGEDATPELKRATSLDALVACPSPPFFLWHSVDDAYVPPDHTYRLAASLAADDVHMPPMSLPTAHVASASRTALAMLRRNRRLCRLAGARRSRRGPVASSRRN